ncbi:hypothetical protein N665_0059s0023 [Sinapis alba]|nr:hypothetical protein N665_0059s0023 [Sinapis alba]
MKNKEHCSEKEPILYKSLHHEENSLNCTSEHGNPSRFLNWKRGFPAKCVCGSDVTTYTSNSIANPGRPYFRCVASRQDGHLFKWVEDGMYEEVQDLLQKVERMEVNELRVEVQNVKEEVLQCKTELKKSKMKCLVSSSPLATSPKCSSKFSHTLTSTRSGSFSSSTSAISTVSLYLVVSSTTTSQSSPSTLSLPSNSTISPSYSPSLSPASGSITLQRT